MAIFLNWNFERRPPQSRQATIMMERTAAEHPDVVCLTEAYEDSTAPLGGHAVTARGASWSFNRRDTERLVVLWSANPWREVDASGNKGTATGAYVAGVTETPDGPMRVIGICAPHHAASQVGAATKAGMWTEQIAFWNGLAVLLADGPSMPTVLLGDFNQYVPRIWGSKAAHASLLVALRDMRVATEGLITGLGTPTIDHLAHTADLVPCDVHGLSRFDDDGRPLSDHFGVATSLMRAAGI